MDTSGKDPSPLGGGGPRRQPQVIDVKVIDVKAEPAPASFGAAKAAEPKPGAIKSEPVEPEPVKQATVRPSASPPLSAAQTAPEPAAAAQVVKVKKNTPHYAYAILLGALTAFAASVALHMIKDPQQQVAGLSAKIMKLQEQLGRVADRSDQSRLGIEADHAHVTALSMEVAKLSEPKNEVALTQNASPNMGAAVPMPGAADTAIVPAAPAMPVPVVPNTGTAGNDATQAPADSSAAPSEPRLAASSPANAAALPKSAVEAPVVQSAASIAALAAVSSSLSSLQGKVATIDQTLPKLDATLAAHETAIKANQAQIVKAMATPNGTALAVVSQSIAAALARGRGFPTEFKALQSLHVDAALLAPLAKVADKGPASTVDLAKSFVPQLAAITHAETPPTPAPQGVMGWIGSKAATLVQLRDTSVPIGHEPGAEAAKVEEALRHGDAAGALKDWNAMPDAAKKLSAAWVAPLKDRAEAEAAAQKLNEGALAVMTGPSSYP